MYVSGVESKLPNGVMLPAEYTELKDSGVTTGFGVFTDALRHIPFCLILQRHCSSILFYSVLCCHPSSLLLFSSASVLHSEYEPRHSRREKPLSARFRIRKVCRVGPLPYRANDFLFSARTATPRIGMSHFRASILSFVYSVLRISVKPWMKTPRLFQAKFLLTLDSRQKCSPSG